MVVKRKLIPADYSSLGRFNWKEADVEFHFGYYLALKESDEKIWKRKLEKINRVTFDVKQGKNCGATPIQRAARALALKNRRDFQNAK